MIKMLKWVFFPATVLVYVVAFFFRHGSTDKAELENVHSEAQQAKANAINANADLGKERINNDTREKLAAAAALSDADIITDAVNEYRAGERHSSGAGPEDQDADSQDHNP